MCSGLWQHCLQVCHGPLNDLKMLVPVFRHVFLLCEISKNNEMRTRCGVGGGRTTSGFVYRWGDAEFQPCARGHVLSPMAVPLASGLSQLRWSIRGTCFCPATHDVVSFHTWGRTCLRRCQCRKTAVRLWAMNDFLSSNTEFRSWQRKQTGRAGNKAFWFRPCQGGLHAVGRKGLVRVCVQPVCAVSEKSWSACIAQASSEYADDSVDFCVRSKNLFSPVWLSYLLSVPCSRCFKILIFPPMITFGIKCICKWIYTL